MEPSPYAKMTFSRGQTRAYAMFPLDSKGFALHGRVVRPDGKPLTISQPGETLLYDGATITLIELTVHDGHA